MSGQELARQTPEEKLSAALKEYAEAKTYGRNVVVSDYAAVMYVEEFKPSGEITPSYLHLTSRRSSWHSLRGLVMTLNEHIFRLKP